MAMDLKEIEKKDFKNVTDILKKSSVHYDELGIVIENELIIDEKTKVSIDELAAVNKNWLIEYMSK